MIAFPRVQISLFQKLSKITTTTMINYQFNTYATATVFGVASLGVVCFLEENAISRYNSAGTTIQPNANHYLNRKHDKNERNDTNVIEIRKEE